MEKIILSHKANLIAVYGNDGFKKIHDALEQLANVSALETEIVYLDDKTSTKKHNLDPVKEANPELIQNFIETLCKTSDAEYLLIIGGHRIIPFSQLKDPTNPTQMVYSDAPYADTYQDDLRSPDISLGRMPDGAVTDPGLVLKQINTAIKHHKGVAAKTTDTTGVSAKTWENVSQELFKKIKDQTELILTPDWGLGNKVPEHINLGIIRPTKWQMERPAKVTEAIIKHVSSLVKKTLDPKAFTGRKFIYFNVHGSDETTEWVGEIMSQVKIEGEDCILIVYPDILKPETIKQANVENAIVFSEACFGAYTIGKVPDNSNALCLLNQGALCFVGSTAVAYGESRKSYPRWADVMVKYFFDFVKRNYSIGEAFQMAKQRYVGTERPFNREDLKTMFEFVLFGDPEIKLS
ncbi:MAG TPA: C25 family cysteine peptidase [Candidatus Deferrimicrobium sp.]|nr:C25 family cysteine peptidase [Candidatus Deferrimicrobium sp.]